MSKEYKSVKNGAYITVVFIISASVCNHSKAEYVHVLSATVLPMTFNSDIVDHD